MAKTTVENKEVIEAVVTKGTETGKAIAVVVDDLGSNLMQQQDLGSFYSVKPVTQAEKIAIYNAVNNPDFRLAEFINKNVVAKDIIVEMIELMSEESGELVVAPRIIILDKDNKSYSCVSIGIFSALKRMIKLFGEPTWNEGVTFTVKQITKGKKNILTLELVA